MDSDLSSLLASLLCCSSMGFLAGFVFGREHGLRVSRFWRAQRKHPGLLVPRMTWRGVRCR